MPRRKDPLPPPPAGASFEDALGGLEAIVESMEHEQLPLEELVSSYEKGCGLLTHCEAILKSARGRIELITLRNQAESSSEGDITDSPPPASLPAVTEEFTDDDDDIRLF